MTLLSAETFIRRLDDEVLYQRGFDSATVIIKPDSNRRFVINPVASTAWELADGQRTIGEIVTVIRATYEGTPETVLQDLIEWASNMAAQKLLTISQSPII